MSSECGSKLRTVEKPGNHEDENVWLPEGLDDLQPVKVVRSIFFCNNTFRPERALDVYLLVGGQKMRVQWAAGHQPECSKAEQYGEQSFLQPFAKSSKVGTS